VGRAGRFGTKVRCVLHSMPIKEVKYFLEKVEFSTDTRILQKKYNYLAYH